MKSNLRMIVLFHFVVQGLKSILFGKSSSKCSTDNLEYKSLSEGGPRVKFQVVWKGPLTAILEKNNGNLEIYYEKAKQLRDILFEMEKCNAAPVLPDGKVGGNGSVKISLSGIEYLLVSKSGKKAGDKMDVDSDFCLVESFDSQQWKAEYYSVTETTLPTSDTPMHFAALSAYTKFSWTSTDKPEVILHGHALASEEESEKAGLPCSTEETLFSTPEDTDALLELMEHHEYPKYDIYIRKGHGFLLLATTISKARERFNQNIVPFM